MSKHSFTNKLITEKSPYLLQHAHNPVNWHPWGPGPFEKAKNEDKLLLVSIGYATCHWCHVMERESFEDPELALFLNQHFVPIKVDREERPDVDKIYMDALQALGQNGGWPLNMFLTPDGKPITGGTYFPPDDLIGKPSFIVILNTLVGIWKNERKRVYQNADTITNYLIDKSLIKSISEYQPDWFSEDKSVDHLRQTFDSIEGGFLPSVTFVTTLAIVAIAATFNRK